LNYSCKKEKKALAFAQPKSIVKRLIPPDLTLLSALGKVEAECQRRQYFRIARPHEGVLAALICNDCSPVRGPAGPAEHWARIDFFGPFFIKKKRTKRRFGTRRKNAIQILFNQQTTPYFPALITI
jgi:hypothetical protein